MEFEHVQLHEPYVLLFVDSLPYGLCEWLRLHQLERLGSDCLLRSDPRLHLDYGGLEHPWVG